MNLRDLQYFIAVAERSSFARAALHCHVSQPTLSMQIKKLEETLGVALFERSHKTVRLTEEGARLLPHARAALAETAAMRALAETAHDPLAGTLRLGIFPTLAPYLLPRVMPHLTRKFPKIRWRLVEEKTPVLLHQLEEGALDAALLASPVQSRSLTHRPCFTEPFYLALHPNHPLATRKNVTLPDVSGLPILLLEDGHCLRTQALEICNLATMPEQSDYRATSLETLRHMVASDPAGMTFIPHLARTEGDGLRYLRFKDATPSRQIALYWRKSAARSPLFAALADTLRERVTLDLSPKKRDDTA